MQTPGKPVAFIILFTGAILLFILFMQPLEVLFVQGEIPVLFPKGDIALKERNLLFVIQVLMLIVIIPVYILTFVFSWRYRAENKNANYDPDLVDHTIAEVIWWGLPFLMVVLIGALTWMKTHELDPYKAIPSQKEPLKVQVVALQWRWLFIYPEEKIATINYLQIPEKTPIQFEITADAPMNSLWIPQLGGQIYAMPGMKTQLNLIADEVGEFRGSSANISGEGFAGMSFMTKATTQEDFTTWINTVKNAQTNLDFESYQKIAAPSLDHQVEQYKLQDQNLFDKIIMKTGM